MLQMPYETLRGHKVFITTPRVLIGVTVHCSFLSYFKIMFSHYSSDHMYASSTTSETPTIAATVSTQLQSSSAQRSIASFDIFGHFYVHLIKLRIIFTTSKYRWFLETANNKGKQLF